MHQILSNVGPLQIGYTPIKQLNQLLTECHFIIKSKYHIDLNNPKVAYDDDSAMTMYGDFSVQLAILIY